jgi:glycoside hydrolase-like protein
VKRVIGTALAVGLAVVPPLLFTSDNSASLVSSRPHVSYLGFDRNDYPGDSALKLLRGRFSFVGFWLNNPPGASSNSWAGKRRVVQDLGFGFLVVFNGRTVAQIKAAGDAAKVGASDAAMAISSARREGFPLRTIIFLDLEEGGRLLPEQRAYLHAWADAVQSAGFRPGVYCSGIAYKEPYSGAMVITAEDIQQNAGGRQLAYWVTNDSCPPSPGCVLPTKPLIPSASGVPFADAWQFTQSPRRTAVTSGCAATYSKDGNCYPPAGEAQRLHVDLDVSISTDPSHGRTR